MTPQEQAEKRHIEFQIKQQKLSITTGLVLEIIKKGAYPTKKIEGAVKIAQRMADAIFKKEGV